MNDRVRNALFSIGIGSGSVGFSSALLITGWTATPLYLIATVALLAVQVALASFSLRCGK